MTQPNFRALCAELLQELCCFHKPWQLKEEDYSDAMKRARALLAQPVAEGPTDEELWELYQGPGTFSPVEYARAVLARWGRPAAAPVAEDVPELVEWLLLIAGSDNSYSHARLTRAAALLQQQAAPAPVPVPVSERLPEFSDCDPQERVWVWNPVLDHWKLSRINRYVHTHWLPAHALPLPF